METGKTYSGNTEAEVKASFAGVVGGEILEKDMDYAIDSANFADENAGKGKAVTATVTLKNTAKANNYNLELNSVTVMADIIRKEITFIVDNKSKEVRFIPSNLL